MSVEGIGSSYYSKMEQKEVVSQKNKSKSIELASFDSNKRYTSFIVDGKEMASSV